MESDPFALVEAMTIAGFATGSEHGYLYLRGEYPLAHRRLGDAIEQARARGFLGEDVMGQGVRFDIELRKGAGAYICGEETALFNSIEGYRGEPRNKPPFPVEPGLFGKPTVVNNVETPAQRAGHRARGRRRLRRRSAPSSRPAPASSACPAASSGRACIEAPFGIRLRELLEMAGGVAGGRPLQAILLGGAAGVFVGPDALDLQLSFEGTRAAGATLGSGVVMVFDDTVDLVPVLLRIAGFFRDESCGQCVPCRVGTVRQQEALLRLAANAAARLGGATSWRCSTRSPQAMRDASICGLGQTAANAIDSAIARARTVPGRGGLHERRSRRAVRSGPSQLEIDGEAVHVPEGSTILDACKRRGHGHPDALLRETLTPVNACRVCVVELEGSRDARARRARARPRPGWSSARGSERVRPQPQDGARVPGLVGRPLDDCRTCEGWMAEYGAQPERYGPPAPPAAAGERDRAPAGHHHAGDGQTAATVAQPVKVDNDLYVRDYAKCILCYKCVEACGTDWQNTFAIAVAGRGFDARIATEYAAPLPDSACVYCGNCIAVCPTGALMFKSEHDMRNAGEWDEEQQTTTETICPYCGVGCSLELHVQDNKIVKVTSPLDHSVTHGNLCVKGRFGFQFVHSRKRKR